jgi:hypothetical protein
VAPMKTTGRRYTLGTGVYTCPRGQPTISDENSNNLERIALERLGPRAQLRAPDGSLKLSYEYLSRPRPPHHGAGMLATTSFEAALLMLEPTVVTM